MTETMISGGRLRFPDDEDYAEFVRAMWNAPDGIDLPFVFLTFRRHGGEPTVRVGAAVRLVRGANGRIYLNMIDEATCRTYAVENDHDWNHDGRPIEADALAAMFDGLSLEDALAPKAFPMSPAEAIAHDRAAPAKGNAYMLLYRDADGREAWRIVSGVLRLPGRITARCHLRWGARRQFLPERILAVHERTTGAEIDLVEFLRPRMPGRREPPAGRPMRPSRP